MADRAAALWNSVNYRCRQAFFTGGRVPSYEALCREFVSHPAYRALPSEVGQETLKKVAAAWQSFFALRRAFGQGRLEHKPYPPRYWKDRKTGQRLSRGIFVKSPRSYSVSRKALALTLPSDVRKRPGDRLVIQTRGLLRYEGELRTCELQYDRVTTRWYAHITVEMPEPVRAPRPEKWAGTPHLKSSTTTVPQTPASPAARPAGPGAAGRHRAPSHRRDPRGPGRPDRHPRAHGFRPRKPLGSQLLGVCPLAPDAGGGPWPRGNPGRRRRGPGHLITMCHLWAAGCPSGPS